jgi:MFS family permease
MYPATDRLSRKRAVVKTIPATPDGSHRGRLGPFRHRPFAVYWAGGLLSNLGTWLQAVAGSIFVYQLTGSPLAVGILNFVGFLPILLFSAFGGIISDRFDRRTVVITTHVVSLVLAGVLAALTFAGAVGELHLIATAFALNTAYAVAKPAIIAMLPALVPRDELTDAVGLNTLQFIFGQIAGPTLAALVMATAGAGWAFTINALTFLGPILSMVYLQRRGLGRRTVEAATATGTGRAPAAEGFGYIRRHGWVLALLTGIVAVSAPLEVIRTLSPALAVEGLGEPESAAGLIIAAQSVGSALALVVFVPFRRRGWSTRMAAVGLVVQAAGLALTAVAPSLVVAAIAVGLVGFGFSLCFPVLTGTLQAEVPDGVRGRVMAIHQMAHLGNRPVTALLAAGLATAFGAQPAVIAGAVLAPVGLVAARAAWQRLAARPREARPADDRAPEAALAAAGDGPAEVVPGGVPVSPGRAGPGG